MKVIVAGCGNVGTAIVKKLAKEGHQITAIDSCEEKLEEVVDYYDAVGINGNAALIDTLIQAGADKCDLFIAVTASDDVNILCCSLAKFCGAKATAARLRNHDYSVQSDSMCKAFSIDFTVNPELELAREIARKLRYPTANVVEELVRGKADLVTVTIPGDNVIDGKKVMELASISRAQFLLCAVERDGAITIPKGGFVLHGGDRISIAATAKNAEQFLKDIHVYRHPPKNVVIVGAGATTSYLAEELDKASVAVKIMYSDQSECDRLRLEMPDNVTVVYGKATNEEVFEEEGLPKADAIISATASDEENILVSLFAKTYKVPVSITKVQSETNRKLLSEVALGDVVSPDRTAATILIKYARALSVGGKSSKLIKLYNIDDKAEAVTFNVEENERIVGKKIREIPFKKTVLCACIVRGNETIIPNGETVILSHDLVVIISDNERLTTLDEAML